MVRAFPTASFADLCLAITALELFSFLDPARPPLLGSAAELLLPGLHRFPADEASTASLQLPPCCRARDTLLPGEVPAPTPSCALALACQPWLQRGGDMHTGHADGLPGRTPMPMRCRCGLRPPFSITLSAAVARSSFSSPARSAVPDGREGFFGQLPVVVTFHGGSFCTNSYVTPHFHAACTRLTAGGDTLHRLPVAIDTATAVLLWLRGQACPFPDADDADPWLAELANPGRVFVIGELADGVLVHHLNARFSGTPGVRHPLRLPEPVRSWPAADGSRWEKTGPRAPSAPPPPPWPGRTRRGTSLVLRPAPFASLQWHGRNRRWRRWLDDDGGRGCGFSGGRVVAAEGIDVRVGGARKKRGEGTVRSKGLRSAARGEGHSCAGLPCTKSTVGLPIHRRRCRRRRARRRFRSSRLRTAAVGPPPALPRRCCFEPSRPPPHPLSSALSHVLPIGALFPRLLSSCSCLPADSKGINGTFSSFNSCSSTGSIWAGVSLEIVDASLGISAARGGCLLTPAARCPACRGTSHAHAARATSRAPRSLRPGCHCDPARHRTPRPLEMRRLRRGPPSAAAASSRRSPRPSPLPAAGPIRRAPARPLRAVAATAIR
ncbi:hypothetical protein SETIT_4G076300v2 [Setaria italica]|uniref:Alpha/beta hydrolase fold-3 domain-containing protein n=1 Tax=Setaria italica TaxID=4555 RepID=A0A368QRZ3_SETIT|nr:hypothetical protein SETIT_4G076300v2 [Setaria italica]